MPEVSIIMPSLNVKRYIRAALDSAISQTLSDIEILCVDAGSDDGTLEIIEEYASRDQRIRVIRSDQKSYGRQMNLGIAAAVGEYIGIIETDDCVLPEMYEELLAAARKKALDVVKADFYRFTGEAADREYVSIAGGGHLSYLYGNVTNAGEDPAVYYVGMNTWSGIYRRDFLRENHICHNKSAGASYQDNGFWFQTITYAKRLCFLDKAYYMNRRDNPDSSVYQKGKALCICDEYQFIRTRMEQEISRNKKIGQILSFFQCRACLFAVERVGETYVAGLAQRISEDFKKLGCQGMMERTYWEDYEWSTVQEIMADWRVYAEKLIAFRNEMIKKIRDYEVVIIYGAGDRGKAVERRIRGSGWAGRLFFAVTQMDGTGRNGGSWNGTEIQEIAEYKACCSQALVIVSTLPRHHKAIAQVLEQYHFKNIVWCSY